MKAYNHNKNTIKVEASNCLVIITDNLTDRKGRNVVSIQVKPDNYAGEHKNIRVGACSNVRVITLKTKKN